MLCGIVVLEGHVSAPTGYWVPVGSGKELSANYDRGVSTTDSK